MNWVKLYKAIPSVEDIFKGNEAKVPTKNELCIALKSAMVAYAAEHPTKKLIDNSIEYACKLPWEFRRGLLHDYYHTTGLRDIIQENDVFKTALKDGLK